MLKQVNVPPYLLFDNYGWRILFHLVSGEKVTSEIPIQVTMLNYQTTREGIFNTQEYKVHTILLYELKGGGISDVVVFNFKVKLESLIMDPSLITKKRI